MGARRLVLVTRPEPGLSEALDELEKRGWQGLACPALEIIPSAPFPPLTCKAILVTSGQALPALMLQERDQLLLTVGAKTARRAYNMGFTNILSASGDAESLKILCLEQHLTGQDIILVCGQGWQGQDYGRKLSDALSVKSLCAYKVRRPHSLSPEALGALGAEQVESVLFYSGETVAAFMDLCPVQLRSSLKKVSAFCYSNAIAAKVSASGQWFRVFVAPYPPSCLS